MELRQLQYFVAVARHGSFTRAAEALWLTQSALSQQVRRLEAEVGVALLRRDSRGVTVTPAGADLLARADVVLREIEHARAELDRHAGASRGAVRVAATTIDVPRLPAALAAFHGAHPGVQIALRHAPAGEVAALVARGVVDLAVAALPGDAPPEVRATPLAGEPMRLMVASGDPLAAAGRVTIGDLRGRPLILAEQGTALRAAVMAACQAAGFSPVPLFEVSEPFTVRSLAAAGLGASVVPASWFTVPGPEVAAVELAATPALEHVVALLTPAIGTAPAAALLAAALREHLG